MYGFEEWPMAGGPPLGQYDQIPPNDVPVSFVWRAYSAQEQAAKWNDPDRPVKMWRATDRYPAGELEPELQGADLLMYCADVRWRRPATA